VFAAAPIEIRTSRIGSAAPVANSAIIATNVLLFVLFQHPGWFLGPGSGWWTTFTYAFSHASPWHLAGNMYVLLMVGHVVNRRIGNGWYVALYLGTILAMGLLGRLTGLGPFVGSSGAIYAVVAVFVMLFPAALVRVAYVAVFPITLLVGFVQPPRRSEWVHWFIAWGSFPVLAWWCILIVPIVELWGMLWWRYALGEWSWAHPAHVLGLLCGVVAVLLFPTRISIGRAAVV
jgi:membrane associated rhomboid family serine protease